MVEMDNENPFINDMVSQHGHMNVHQVQRMKPLWICLIMLKVFHWVQVIPI